MQRYVIEQIEHRRFEASFDEMAVVFAWTVAAERARLQERVHRLSALLDSIDETAIVLSPDGRVRYVNRPGQKILHDFLGLAPQEVMGKTVAELGIPANLKIGLPPA